MPRYMSRPRLTWVDRAGIIIAWTMATAVIAIFICGMVSR
jgi:hypothetical protein